MNSEKVIYKGGPSQVINYNVFAICTIIFLFAIWAPSLFDKYFLKSYGQFEDYVKIGLMLFFFAPIAYGFWAWLKVRCHRYIVTTERLMEEEGVFTKETNELELYRVKDITFVEPFTLRVFGCGNIILDTSDKSTPIVFLHAIKNGRPILDKLRHHVQIMRERKGVREID